MRPASVQGGSRGERVPRRNCRAGLPTVDRALHRREPQDQLPGHHCSCSHAGEVHCQVLLVKAPRLKDFNITVEPLISPPHGIGCKSEHQRSRIIRGAKINPFKKSATLILEEKHTYKNQTQLLGTN